MEWITQGKTEVCNSAHLSKINIRLSHNNLFHLANIINLNTVMCLLSLFILLSHNYLETYYFDTKEILHFQTSGNYTNGWQINKHKNAVTIKMLY